MNNKEKQIDENIGEPTPKRGETSAIIVLTILGVLAFVLITGLFLSNAFAEEPNTNEVVDNTVETVYKEEPDTTICETTVETVFEETIVETEPETTPETEPVVPAVRYFNVPLSEDLQNHIFTVCESRGVNPALVIAIVRKESTYRAEAIGDSGRSLGLMQIQPRWHSGRMSRLGCLDLLDPYQNVTVGIDILAELFSTGGSLDWVLMAYNGGYGHANGHIAAGTISDYAATVKYYMNTLERK